MSDTKAGGYISKITFNNGKELEIKQDDIVVFVGPNNAGKSQSLKDIYHLSLSKNKQSGIVITDIVITKYPQPILPLLESISKVSRIGLSTTYQFMGRTLNIGDDYEQIFAKEQVFGNVRNLFIANLDTSTRLTTCFPPINITRNDAKQHPIHYAAYNGTYRKCLSDNFKRAFHIEVTPNTQFGASVPLCIGEPVNFGDKEFVDEQTRQEAYATILDTYKQVQDQGDGINSFTGILLYL